MIYITQLIFVEPGKESTFLEFEAHAIPLMEKYTGRMLYRIRPDRNAFVDAVDEQPYEIHIISFDAADDLAAFLKDDERQALIHLKNESIRSTLLLKGEKM